MSKSEQSIEKNFEEIENIIEQLEAPDISLEQAFGVYSKGMKKLQECHGQIDRVEKQILKLNEQGDLEEL